MTGPPIACTLTEPELRQRRAGLLRRVRDRVVETRPLAAAAAAIPAIPDRLAAAATPATPDALAAPADLEAVAAPAAPVSPAAAPAPAATADGIELRFPGGDEATVADVLELVRLESRCCAFLRFRVTLEPGGGPVVLEISGPPGAAEILAGELTR
jgi:hypothetical protein